jgi:DNA-binding transcriptional LysR family regulator
MDIHQLRIFASVYKNRSFSKASTELHLTQPTISDHIKALEEELNSRLFDRLGRTIIPTPQAEILYNYAVEIIEKAEEARNAINEIKAQPSGEILIGASTIPGTYLLPSVIRDFKYRFPLVEFKLEISDSKGIFEKVLNHELLLGIIGAKLTNSNIIYTPLTEDILIIVASPKLIRKSTITLENLKTIPFVLREEGSGTRKEMEKLLEQKGLSSEDLKIACVFGSTEAVKEAVKAGLGIAVLSKISVKDELRTGTLKEIKIPGLELKRKFYAIVHKKRTLPYQYRLFLEALTSALKTEVRSQSSEFRV